MVEIRINYETLFDLLRREKNREELQKLDDDFYEQVFAYLKEKDDAISRKEDRTLLSAEKEKLKIQYQNIRRIVKELYEKREKKIINMAVVKAKTGSDVIDTSNLLPVEREFFENEVALIGRNKEEVLDSILLLKESSMIKISALAIPPRAQPASNADDDSSSEYEEPSFSASAGISAEAHFSSAKDGSSNSAADEERKKVRFLVSLPKFVGKNSEVLGPYSEGDEAALDSQIAEILIRKGKAEVL
jgi:DNA replication initiation complex subunit (GINS family)